MGLREAFKNAITPGGTRAVHYRCGDCNREFTYHADLSGPTCPYCDTADLESVDPP